jgi:3-hydroxymyristoyl/3-hydroxydecanoyl-(acyl carrier protein) dehydratase
LRWQFIDRIEKFEPWDQISGRKVVSFEEVTLLEPFGMPGDLPTSLIVESLVQLAYWLVVGSSDFIFGCVLSGVENLCVDKPVKSGCQLRLDVSVAARDSHQLEVKVEADSKGDCVCRGTLTLDLIPLNELQDTNELEYMWSELHGDGIENGKRAF